MIPEMETTAPPPTLRERAYALRFNPDNPPPPDEVCMSIGGVPVASRGNLTVLQGKSKVGKSAVISSFIGASIRGEFIAKGDTLCFEWIGEATGKILHLDTEQSGADWHALVMRGLHRSGLSELGERMVSLPLVMFNRSERLEILRQSLEYESGQSGGIDLVLIDGVADLCISPNDEPEALEIVSELHAMARQYHVAIVCVLHENPSAQDAKTRGHLGSELNRKAFANLRIDKDAETLVSTIYGTDMRKRDIPKDHGFCFSWDDAAGMHSYQGRANGVKASRREAEAVSRERDYFTPLFDSIGTNGACPDSTPDELTEAHRDIIGTNKAPNRDAMKKRMQRAESIGVLRKSSRTTWTLTPSGESGHERDK
jgi:hypothetical protein